jgi:hypothetical protein
VSQTHLPAVHRGLDLERRPRHGGPFARWLRTMLTHSPCTQPGCGRRTGIGETVCARCWGDA